LGFWVKKPLALIFFFKNKGVDDILFAPSIIKKKKGPSACALTKNPFVYTAAAAAKIKRRKIYVWLQKKRCLLFMGPTFYCVINAVIAKQQEAAFVSTVNNGQHIFTHCSC